jgi:hypothetical protein
MKSLVKLYKDKLECRLCSEPAENDSIQCKTWLHIFHFKWKDVTQLITQKHMSVEYGSAVVLKSPQKTNFFNRRFPKYQDFFPFENKTH